MSGDTILVRLEAVGQRRFRRDMKVSARSVAGLTKAHLRASKAARKHGQETKKLSSGLKVLGMVAGRAGGPQGVGMLAQALQSASVAAASLTAAVGGLTAALGALGSAAAKGLGAVADAAGVAANRLRELASLLWSALSATTVRGTTAALAGMIPVLNRIRTAVRGVAAAFAAVGTSTRVRMASFGEVLPGAGPGAGLVAAATASAAQPAAGRPAPVAAPAGSGGKANAFSLLGRSTSKLGEVPAVTVPFAGLMTASIDEINKAALPGLIEGMGSLNEAFQKIVDSGALQTIGVVMGDTFSWLGGAIKDVVGYLEKIGALGPAIKGVAIAFAAFKIVGFVSTLASLANPLTLVIVGIGALAAGAIYAYENFEWFRTIVDGAWNVLKSIGTWIIENWQLVLSLLTGPLGAAVILIATNFGTIKNAAMTALEWVRTAITNVVEFIKGVPGMIVELATALPGMIADAFAGLPGVVANIGNGLWEGLKGGLVEVLNWAIDKINVMIDGFNKVNPFGDVGRIDRIGGGDQGSGTAAQVAGPYLEERGTHIPGGPRSDGFTEATKNILTRARGGSVPGGPPFDDRVPSLLTPGEHVWTRGEVKAAGGHRAVAELRRNVAGGAKAASPAPRYVSVEAPVQVRIGEGVLADAMANIHLKMQAGIPT